MWYAIPIALKEIRLHLRDTRSFVILLLLPMLFIAVLGMSTGQFLTESKDQSQIRLAVYDQGQSVESQELHKSLARLDWLTILPVSSENEGSRVLKKRDATVLLTIGPRFAAIVDELTMHDILKSSQGRLSEGPQALDLQVDSLPGFAGTASIIGWLVYSDAIRTITPFVAAKNQIARRWIGRKDSGDANEDGDDSTTNDNANSPAIAVQEVNRERSLSNAAGKISRKKGGVYNVLVPGFTVMFVFFIVNLMARSFIQERELGTLRRLKLAPIPAFAILLGKTIPFLILSLLQTSILFVCGRLLFGMPWGPQPLWLIPAFLCTSAAATSLGLFVATLVKTDQQVSSYGNAVVLILGVLSGCFLPREWLPDRMSWISLATPQAWSRFAFDAVISGHTVDALAVVGPCLVLLGFSMVFFWAGWTRFSGQTLKESISGITAFSSAGLKKQEKSPLGRQDKIEPNG